MIPKVEKLHITSKKYQNLTRLLLENNAESNHFGFDNRDTDRLAYGYSFFNFFSKRMNAAKNTRVVPK